MKTGYFISALGLLALIASPATAVVAGQVDDFQDGTVQGWSSGASLSQVANGGPDGLGDGYLQISQSNFHVSTKNIAQWAGDYTTAGVTAMGMDLNPISVTPNAANPAGILEMRLVLFGPGGAFTSTNATPLGSGWNNYIFDLSDMIFLSGSGNSWPGGGTTVLADTLAAVSRVLIRNDPAVTPTPIGFHPQHITATLGLDNIRALPDGDVNGDGFVGGDDLSAVLTNWGLTGAGRKQGDLDGDGFVGGGDYSKVLTFWGMGIPPETLPEPATMMILVAGGLAVLIRRPGRLVKT